MAPIVEVTQLAKIYDSGTMALQSVSFSVEEGDVFGIIGVNGAGKTTLIRILTTMLKQSSGECKIDDIDPSLYPEKVRSLIGVLPQESGLYEEFTIYENLAFIGEMQGKTRIEIQHKIEEVSALLGIADRLTTRVNQLSGGLKQRAMIARTLMGDPKILFLDEPTTGLDVLVARKVRQIIRDLSKHMTIFLATHNMYEAYQLCSKVAILKQGNIIKVDSPKNIYDTHRQGDDDFEDVIARILGIDEQSISSLEAGL
ncbi:MAG: ABC transporter ATP-binding protein [Candidatus Heimdallarchaeota archaeon]|nr:ABC transporter ATP-binding protein [Candidatus Heimdallarchaeota archaeon]